MFDLGELCVLLDLDHPGSLSIFPEPAESVTLQRITEERW